jgi:pyrroline-5-carboxylate reductase
MDERIGFIGATALAEALARGLVASGRSPASIIASDPQPEQREKFAALGTLVAADDVELVTKADTIVLAVTPSALENVLADIAPRVTPGKLVVTIATGIRADFVRRALPHANIVRAVCNAPCLVGKGVSVLYADSLVAAADRARAERIFNACGISLWVPDERSLEIAAALCSAGTTCFSRLCEILAAAAIDAGLPAESAARMVRHTFFGAALLAAAGRDITELHAIVEEAL